MSSQEVKSELLKKKGILAEDIADYINSLSKEMNIFDTQGVKGNELELIALVRNCKFLYDKNEPDFKDVRKKNAAWKAIANVMNAPVLDVQKRWRSLREFYNRYKKELENCNTSEGNVQVWEYYDDMRFIETHIVHRKSNSSKCNGSTSDDEYEETSKDDGISVLPSYDSSDALYKFIAAVECKPILYDSKNVDFRNRKLRKSVWEEISQTFGITSHESELKWKRLRERYGRERKLLQKGENDGKCWQYFDALSFLNSFVKLLPLHTLPTNKLPRQQQSNDNIQLNQASADSKNTSLIKAVALPEMQTVDFTDDSSPQSSPSAAYSDNQVSRGVDLGLPRTVRHTADEDDLFGQMIAAELKMMPRGKKKLKLKADMYRLLCENDSDD